MRMDNLATAYVIDPYILNSFSQIPHVFLSSSSKSGGNFWDFKLFVNGLNRCWGKLQGKQADSRFVPVEHCAKNNPVMELKIQMAEKLRNGYSLVFKETFLP
jgi:hypothetical protein